MDAKQTERLYWSAPLDLEFEAEILEIRAQGRGFAIVLDRTLFHPESGGQPCDLGVIGQASVTAVREEGGRVVHEVETRPGDVGHTIRGRIDGARRLDLATQHTAQHVLSAVALRDLGRRTVGFHLGEDVSTLDLEPAFTDAADVERLEDLANEELTRDRVVRSRVLEPGERVAFRRDPRLDPGTPIRAVEIEGLDCAACCGTHLERTGQAGILRVVKTDKIRSSTRLEFVAGRRALLRMRRLDAIVNDLSRETGAGPFALGEWATAALREVRELRAEAVALRREIDARDAEALLAAARDDGKTRVVAAALSPRPPERLREMASALAAHPGIVALLGAPWDGRAIFAFARARDVDIHAGDILRAALAAVGGRGGGRPDMAQGGAPDATGIESVLARAIAAMKPDND